MADALNTTLNAMNFVQVAGATSFALNQSTDAFEVMFSIDENMTISRVGLLFSAKTGTATTWIMGLQGDNLGVPDGTFLGGGTPASCTFTNSEVTAGTFFFKNLDNTYSATAGDQVSLVCQYSSGTAPSAGVNDLTVTTLFAWGSVVNYPYSITNDAGSRTRSASANPNFGYGTTTRVYGSPVKGAYSQSWNSGSSPAVYSMRFIAPTGLGSSLSVIAARWLLGPPSTSVDNTIVQRLYSGTTVLQDVTHQGANTASTTSRPMTIPFDESSLTALTPGAEYRIALAPQTANSFNIRGITVDSNDYLEPFAGGKEAYLSTLSAGVWTDTNTTRPFCELILKDITTTGSSTYVIPVFPTATGLQHF